jgi:hypothetical protein
MENECRKPVYAVRVPCGHCGKIFEAGRVDYNKPEGEQCTHTFHSVKGDTTKWLCDECFETLTGSEA